MPLYVGDYLADTQHLTTTQHGAYLLLIMHYWQNGGLPSDDVAIGRISRLNRDQWRANCQAIASMFEAGWKHKRIDRELEKANNISTKRTLAGQRGGQAKATKSHNGFPAIAKQMGTQSQSHIDSSTNSESEKASPQKVGERSKPQVSSSLADAMKAKGWVS